MVEKSLRYPVIPVELVETILWNLLKMCPLRCQEFTEKCLTRNTFLQNHLREIPGEAAACQVLLVTVEMVESHPLQELGMGDPLALQEPSEPAHWNQEANTLSYFKVSPAPSIDKTEHAASWQKNNGYLKGPDPFS